MEDLMRELEKPTYPILVGSMREAWSADFTKTHLGNSAGLAAIFEASQYVALQAVDQQHATFMRNLTGNATIEERDTWQSKELAARALVAQIAANAEAASSNEDPPQIVTAAQSEMLTIEATYLGTDAATLAATVIGKADLFKKLTGLAAGVRGKARAAIKAAATPEQLQAAVDTAQADVQTALASFTGV